MHKRAARYASQPTINIQGGQQGMGMMGGQGRFGGLFPMTPGTNLQQASAAARNNPNPAANPSIPQMGGSATVQGIQQAQAKAAEALWRGYTSHQRAAGGLPGIGRALGLSVSTEGSAGLLGASNGLSGWAKMASGHILGATVAPTALSQALSYLTKRANGMPPAPPPGGAMPPGGAPPMPPGGGMPPPGMPMDPAMMGGMPPGPPPGPVDPTTGQPVAPPMGTPPPPPLPSNPRPNPPRPKTSDQAMQEATWLQLMEQKQQASEPQGEGQATEDINDQLMGMGGKMASVKVEQPYVQDGKLTPEGQGVFADIGSARNVVPHGLNAGVHGATLGAVLGTLAGYRRGNTPEGLGRGIIRGGATGVGAGLGGTLGSHLASKTDNPLLAAGLALGGTGLGGLLGYGLAGRAMGKPVGISRGAGGRYYGGPDSEEKEANLKTTFWKRAKLEIGHASMPEKLIGDTAGRVGNVLTGAPLLTTDMLRDPTLPDREQEHVETARLMEGVRPDQLGDVKVRLGGTNLLDDMKRVWTNKRTGPIGKVVGTLSTPMSSVMGSLFRSPHYNPWSNTVVQTAHNKPITEHELGHAIDFNEVAGKQPSKNFWMRQLQGTGRDLYGLAYGVPFANLWHEAQANRKSRMALEDALKDKPDELEQRKIDRLKVLPAAYSTYVTGNLGLGAIGSVGGMLGTKAIGHGIAHQRQKALDAKKQEGKRDGDGDGKREEEEQKKAAMDKIANSKLRALFNMAQVGTNPSEGLTSYALRLGQRQIGSLDLRNLAGKPQIAAVDIAKQYRGLGLGRKLYGDLLRQHGTLHSDGVSVSPDAQRVWQSLAQRPAYSVAKNPQARNLGKDLITKDESPVFTGTFLPKVSFDKLAVFGKAWGRLGPGLGAQPAAVPMNAQGVIRPPAPNVPVARNEMMMQQQMQRPMMPMQMPQQMPMNPMVPPGMGFMRYAMDKQAMPGFIANLGRNVGRLFNRAGGVKPPIPSPVPPRPPVAQLAPPVPPGTQLPMATPVNPTPVARIRLPGQATNNLDQAGRSVMDQAMTQGADRSKAIRATRDWLQQQAKARVTPSAVGPDAQLAAQAQRQLQSNPNMIDGIDISSFVNQTKGQGYQVFRDLRNHIFRMGDNSAQVDRAIDHVLANSRHPNIMHQAKHMLGKASFDQYGMMNKEAIPQWLAKLVVNGGQLLSLGQDISSPATAQPDPPQAPITRPAPKLPAARVGPRPGVLPKPGAGGGRAAALGLLGTAGLAGAHWLMNRGQGQPMAKAAEDITYTDPRTGRKVTADHNELGKKLANQLMSAARGNKEAEMLHNAMVENLRKFAAQEQDGETSPKRSATGESEGLTFAHKEDDYAKGQDAWEATSKYFKGGSKVKKEPNPYLGKHANAPAAQAPQGTRFTRDEEIRQALERFRQNEVAKNVEITDAFGRGGGRTLGTTMGIGAGLRGAQSGWQAVAKGMTNPSLRARFAGAGAVGGTLGLGMGLLGNWLGNHIGRAWAPSLPQHMRQSVGRNNFSQVLADYQKQLPDAPLPQAQPQVKPASDLSPFARAFFDRCDLQGLTYTQIKEGMDRLVRTFPEVREELESGLEKRANPGAQVLTNTLRNPGAQSFGRSLLNWGSRLFGGGGGQAAAQTGQQVVRQTAPITQQTIGAGRQVVQRLTQQHAAADPMLAAAMRAGGAEAQAATQLARQQAMQYARQNPMMARFWGSGFGNAVHQTGQGISQLNSHMARHYGGGIAHHAGSAALWGGLGGMSGEMDENAIGISTPWGGKVYWNPYRGAMSAAMWNPALGANSRAMTSGWRGALTVPVAAYRGQQMGGFTGMGVDMAAQYGLGIDTGGRFSQLGSTLGGLTAGTTRAGQWAANTGARGSMLRNLGVRTQTMGAAGERMMGDFGRGLVAPITSGARMAWNGAGTVFNRMRGVAPNAAPATAALRNPTTRSLAEQAGRVIGIGGAGLAAAGGGLALGRHLIGSELRNQAAGVYEGMRPAIERDMQGMVDGQLDRLGLRGENGQLDLTNALPQSVHNIGNLAGQVSNMGNSADGIFRSIGMDPSRMSPFQKLMILGGVMGGGAGMMSGNGTMATVGGGAALAGLLPMLMQGQRQDGTGQGGSPGVPGNAAGAMQTLTAGAAPVNAPSYRNEWLHQLQSQQGGAPQ